MNSETGFSSKLRRLTALLHVCVMIRGELAIGRGTSRHTLVFGRSVRDPDHDAVMRIGGEAPGGGPILPVGICVPCLSPVPATSDRQSAVRPEPSASAE